MITRTIHSDFSGHTMFVQEISADKMPPHFENKDGYRRFYSVRNFDAEGVVFMYLGTSHPHAPREIVAWYSNGGFWMSYGRTLKEAIEGAQKDGWLYA